MTVFGGRDDDYLLQGFGNHAKKRFHGELQALVWFVQFSKKGMQGFFKILRG